MQDLLNGELSVFLLIGGMFLAAAAWVWTGLRVLNLEPSKVRNLLLALCFVPGMYAWFDVRGVIAMAALTPVALVATFFLKMQAKPTARTALERATNCEA